VVRSGGGEGGMGWEFGVVDGKMEFCTCYFFFVMLDYGKVCLGCAHGSFLLCISYLLLWDWWG
jgi:hypothetical protein